jgi:hypothetical protein
MLSKLIISKILIRKSVQENNKYKVFTIYTRQNTRLSFENPIPIPKFIILDIKPWFIKLF